MTTLQIQLVCESCGARATVPEIVEVSGLSVGDGSTAAIGARPVIFCMGPTHAPHPANEMARTR